MKNPFNFSPNIEGGESFEAYCQRCNRNKKSILAVLTLFIGAVLLWLVVLMQGCQLQHADAVKFEAYSQHALELEQELKLDAARLQAIDPVAAQIVLDTLEAVQQVKQDVVLDDINISR